MMTEQTEQETMTLAWWLAEKHETPMAVTLRFERAYWWTGDDEATFQDVDPGTPGAGTDHDRGEGEMTLRLSHDVAARFEVDRQYTFTSNVRPLYEGE